jgi:hypothetical protein
MSNFEKTLGQHQSDFLPDAWDDYTETELLTFAYLLAKRGTHRLNILKANKDFEDARNYMTFLQEKHTRTLDLIKLVEMGHGSLSHEARVSESSTSGNSLGELIGNVLDVAKETIKEHQQKKQLSQESRQPPRSAVGQHYSEGETD